MKLEEMVKLTLALGSLYLIHNAYMQREQIKASYDLKQYQSVIKSVYEGAIRE